MLRKLVTIAIATAGLLGATAALAGDASHEDHDSASVAEPTRKGASCCDHAAMQMHMHMHMHSRGQRPAAVEQTRTEGVQDVSPLERHPTTTPSDG